MRRQLTTLLFATFTAIACAQQSAEQIYISVAMPAQCPIDGNTKTILKNKLLAIATANDVAATECGALAMVPELSTADESLVEGGMRNIHTVELQLTIKVSNIITGTVFHSMHITCKGSGYSKSEAQRSAINSIKTAEHAASFSEGKRRIISYYRENTPAIISKAKTLAQQQQYDEALALLASYPESLSGYAQVSAAISSIFHKAQTRYCQQLLQSARSAYAQRDFQTAAETLSLIDATSDCASEAKKLQSSIKRDEDAVYRNEVASERESRMAKERIATATINAARDVAVAYCKRQTKYLFFW